MKLIEEKGIKKLFFIITCFLIVACKANKLVFQTKVELDEYLDYNGILIFKNLTEDTILIPESIDFIPIDNDVSANSINLFFENEKLLDTMRSKIFSFTPKIYFDSELGYLPRSIKLNPKDSYEFKFPITLFYNLTKDGNYVYRICFLTNLQTMHDTCITDNFKYIHKNH